MRCQTIRGRSWPGEGTFIFEDHRWADPSQTKETDKAPAVSLATTKQPIASDSAKSRFYMLSRKHSLLHCEGYRGLSPSFPLRGFLISPIPNQTQDCGGGGGGGGERGEMLIKEGYLVKRGGRRRRMMMMRRNLITRDTLYSLSRSTSAG